MKTPESIIEAMKSDTGIRLTKWGSERILKVEEGKFLVYEPAGRGRHYHREIHYNGESETEAVKVFLEDRA